MSYLYRILKFAFQDFYRNIWLSIVTITILILTLLSINILVVFNAMAEAAVTVIEDKIDISVYFKPSTEGEQIDEIKVYILSLPEVSEVQYISQEEALVQFKETHKDDPTILEAVEELEDNPLGATIRIKARNVDSYPVILEAIDKAEYNQLIISKDYDDRQEMISRISQWTKTGEKIVLIFILVFVLISALIVFNTVRVAIYTHREEIAIEKLVGATNWFVRLPFLLESILYSLVACILIVGIIYPLLNFIQPYLADFFGQGHLDLVAYFNNNFTLIFGLQFIVISVLNILASLVATRKYLRV